MGPSTEPCGIPCTTLVFSEGTPLITVSVLLNFKNFINISDHRRLTNSNQLQKKFWIFCCVLKDFDLIN